MVRLRRKDGQNLSDKPEKQKFRFQLEIKFIYFLKFEFKREKKVFVTLFWIYDCAQQYATRNSM